MSERQPTFIEELKRRKVVRVLIAYLIVVAWGIYAVANTPMDAIPDLSENQVIVFTEWMGRSPQLVEDQVTFPLVTALQGVPEVHAIRAQSMFGMSFVYVIFEDRTDAYWARSRVLEKLSTVQSALPAGAKMQLGPDGTGVGHVFWYTVEGAQDLGTLRAIQDWYVKLNLQGVQGDDKIRLLLDDVVRLIEQGLVDLKNHPSQPLHGAEHHGTRDGGQALPDRVLVLAYNAADVFVVPSLYDNIQNHPEL